MKFSVVISVCAQDNSNWFREALKSVIKQTAMPSEIIITQDGVIDYSLQNAIEATRQDVGDTIPIVIINKEVNTGRGALLREAVGQASHPLIAIMDSDDLSVENRFQKQLQIFNQKDVDVVGSWISEFDENLEQCYAQKKPPIEHAEIYKYGSWRNPINQMSVMFKKESALRVGNYIEIKGFEDMWLWVRMLKGGCTFYNIPEPLVMVRGGKTMVQRRRGLKYAYTEAKLLVKMYKIGFISPQRLVLLFITRLPLRIMPNLLLTRFYTLLRK